MTSIGEETQRQSPCIQKTLEKASTLNQQESIEQNMAADRRIHDKSQHEHAPDHADVHLSRGLTHAVVELGYQIHHSCCYGEIHQPLELWEVVQRW